MGESVFPMDELPNSLIYYKYRRGDSGGGDTQIQYSYVNFSKVRKNIVSNTKFKTYKCVSSEAA